MITRMTITLTQEERKALMEYAVQELRDPHAQAVYILRVELERLGFLQPEPKQAEYRNTTRTGVSINDEPGRD